VSIEQFPVEAGAIRVWAQAIGDDNPVYFSESAAAAAGLAAIPAPPTFLQAAEHFSPASPVRPIRGRPWHGSGAGPGLPADAAQGMLHAEQHFEFHRPVLAGDVLSAATVPGTSWVKAGRRGGELRFEDQITEYRDAAGELVVTVRSVAVLTEHVPTAGSS
jgi:acyl dehydratase